jgi:hypothetical protein
MFARFSYILSSGKEKSRYFVLQSLRKKQGSSLFSKKCEPSAKRDEKKPTSESISSYVVFLEPQFSKIDANNLIKSDFETLPHHIPALRISIEIPSANIIMVE